MESTSPSLLLRLKQSGHETDWNRFVALYSPLIRHWATACGLREQDADDLTQDVLATLIRKMPGFEYDPQRSFRGWLKTVTRNLWLDRARRRGDRLLSADEETLLEVTADDRIGQLIDQEYATAVTQRAMHLIRDEMSEQSWNACWQFAVLKRPAIDVAKELGTTPTAVYAASARVLARLRMELAGLLD